MAKATWEGKGLFPHSSVLSSPSNTLRAGAQARQEPGGGADAEAVEGSHLPIPYGLSAQHSYRTLDHP